MSKKDNLKKNGTCKLIASIVLIELLFFCLLIKLFEMIFIGVLTPSIQNEYYVKTTISSSEGISVSEVLGPEFYINPLAKTFAFLAALILSMLSIWGLYKLIKKASVINLKVLLKIKKYLRICILILGILVTVYGWNKVELKNLGIYKSEFQNETELEYYRVKNMPVAAEFLSDNKFYDCIVTNSGTVIAILGRLIGCSGGLVYILDVIVDDCKKDDDEKNKRKMIDDISSQVIEKIKRKGDKICD